MTDKNFEIAWKTIRNNRKFTLPEEFSEDDHENVWELRKQWFTYGWNNSLAFKDPKVVMIDSKKKIHTV